jgi:hypothetical protein
MFVIVVVFVTMCARLPFRSIRISYLVNVRTVCVCVYVCAYVQVYVVLCVCGFVLVCLHACVPVYDIYDIHPLIHPLSFVNPFRNNPCMRVYVCLCVCVLLCPKEHVQIAVI